MEVTGKALLIFKQEKISPNIAIPPADFLCFIALIPIDSHVSTSSIATLILYY